MRLNIHNTASPGQNEQIQVSFYNKYKLKTVFLSLIVLYTFATVAAVYKWREQFQSAAVILSANAGLRLEKIRIYGRINTSQEDLINALDAKWYQPIFDLDLVKMHQRVEALGWVQNARIQRKLPLTLTITLTERKALALYQDEQGHQVVDRNGEVIQNTKAEDFTHLPVIKGDQAAKNALEILNIMKTEPDLFAEVWSLTYQSKRRWDVYLRNNIRIQLPEKNTQLAWEKLAKMDSIYHLTSRDVINIDLRVPDKLVIRPAQLGKRKGSQT